MIKQGHIIAFFRGCFLILEQADDQSTNGFAGVLTFRNRAPILLLSNRLIMWTNGAASVGSHPLLSGMQTTITKLTALQSAVHNYTCSNTQLPRIRNLF
jgi:hypothetical protein